MDPTLNGIDRSALEEQLRSLRLAIGADRTTLRVDDASRGLDVDHTAAESRGEGVPSIAGDSSIDQRALETVHWLQQHQCPLVQDDFETGPRPPAALVELYGVRAQMLCPLLVSGEVTGWVSVHSQQPRRWSQADVAVLTTSSDRIARQLGFGN